MNFKFFFSHSTNPSVVYSAGGAPGLNGISSLSVVVWQEAAKAWSRLSPELFAQIKKHSHLGKTVWQPGSLLQAPYVLPCFRWSTQLPRIPHLKVRKRTKRTWRTGNTPVKSPPPASRSSFSPKTAKKSFLCKSLIFFTNRV